MTIKYFSSHTAQVFVFHLVAFMTCYLRSNFGEICVSVPPPYKGKQIVTLFLRAGMCNKKALYERRQLSKFYSCCTFFMKRCP